MDRYWKPEPTYTIFTNKQEAKLPILMLDPDSFGEGDAALIDAMMEYPPKTAFRPGDLCYLKECPPHLRVRNEAVPSFWKVRMIVSAWQFVLHRFAHDPNQQRSSIRGLNLNRALEEAHSSMEPYQYSNPMLYCHAVPHGMYPDTAYMFPERIMRRVALREHNPQWREILDEAQADFMGYDVRQMAAPFAFDLAPDFYKDGENLGKPFIHEEETFHTACLLGLEEKMVRPVAPRLIGNRRIVDPEHDIFG